VTAGPKLPSGFWRRTSISTLRKSSVTCSIGRASLPVAPVGCTLETTTSSNVNFMNSCWPRPALRPVMTALRIDSPWQAASNSRGVAVSIVFTKRKSSTRGRPPGFGRETSKPKLSTSISFLCLSSLLSPGIPSIFRK
jgi:hypothetical protein